MNIWIVFCSGIVSALAGLTYKFRHKHRFPIDLLLALFAFFYTLFTAFCLLIFGETLYSRRALVLGVCSGLTQATVIRLMFIVTSRVKLNISWTVIQFSVLVPFFLSVVLFREIPAPRTLIGVGCIFTSIPFFGLGKSKGQSGPSIPDLKTGLLLFLCSFLTGVMFSIPKLYTHLEPGGGIFTLLLYNGLAMIPLTGILFASRAGQAHGFRASLGITTLSIYMALTNVGAIALLMIALHWIDGSVVYPLRTVVNILSIFFLSFVLFREKANLLEGVGAVVALIGLVLVSSTMG